MPVSARGDSKVLVGVDYYPEQWPRARWPIDAKLMADAGVRVVRVGEFAWSEFEPAPGRYAFAWLDDALQLLRQHDISVVLGTPTATPPAWLIQRHPEILPVDPDGVRVGFGGRRHYCPTRAVYRRYAGEIVTSLADHYREHGAVIGWQIDNEFACHRGGCFCEECRTTFQRWLQRRYGSLEHLNETWGTAFWSQTYTAWEQIPLPARTVAVHNPALRLDFQRFVSDAYTEFQDLQIEILRTRCPRHFITTNLMGLFDEIDYFKLSRPLDFVAWDNYPGYHGPADPMRTAMAHDLTRSLKHRKFWVMEQQAGPTAWEGGVDRSPPPGLLRLWTWQAVAHGAEAVIYFRWRTATQGAEQFWHGILDHDGRPRRRYEEVARTAAELAGLELPPDAVPETPVAIVLSYDDRWAWKIQPQHAAATFDRRVGDWYRMFRDYGIGVEFVAPGEPLRGYRVAILPSLFMLNDATAHQAEEFTRTGGLLIVGPRTGVKDETSRVRDVPPPGPLSELLGVEVDEYDAIGTDDAATVDLTLPGLPSLTGRSTIWSDVLGPRSADVVAVYRDQYYAGRPAATLQMAGRGAALYVGGFWESGLLDGVVRWALRQQDLDAAVVRRSNAHDVEAVVWRSAAARYLFLLNHGDRSASLGLAGQWAELATQQPQSETVSLQPFAVKLFVAR